MPSAVNGIPHATPSDSVSSWPATSEQLAEWIDANAVTDDDSRLTNARRPTAHEHTISDVSGLTEALNSKISAADIPAPEIAFDTDGVPYLRGGAQ